MMVNSLAARLLSRLQIREAATNFARSLGHDLQFPRRARQAGCSRLARLSQQNHAFDFQSQRFIYQDLGQSQNDGFCGF